MVSQGKEWAMKTWVVLLCGLLLVAGSAFAQPTSQHTGDENYSWQRTGMPSVLRLSTDEVKYQFDGSQVKIPFTISSAGNDVPDAIVWLAVYTKDANPQYLDDDGNPIMGAGGINGAVKRAAGIDTLIFMSEGQTFPQGDNIFLWDGTDWTGNPVGEGTYTFYLFAFNVSLDPTVVGIHSQQPLWTNCDINWADDPPTLWGIENYKGWMVRSVYGVDILADREAFESYDLSWTCAEATPGNGTQFFFYGSKLDPVDPTIIFLLRADPWGDNDKMGMWRTIFDGESILPDETWQDAGFLDMQPWVNVGGTGLALKHAEWHPWLEDDGLIWVMRYGLDDDPDQTIAKGYDRATGDLVTFVDMTSYYLQVINDVLRVRTGLALDLDEDGVYTVGSWAKHDNPDAVAPSHWTYDGDMLWVNQNGDGFLDRVTDELAEVTGLPVAIPYVANVSVGKYNMSYFTGMDMDYLAAVAGPDGSGLFEIPSTKAARSLYGDGWHQWTGEETPYDGWYVGVQNGSYCVQWPYDVQSATISPGVPEYVQEVETVKKPSRFALESNYPNPFNASTTIRFAIPEGVNGVRATLKVHNMAGQEIATLAHEILDAGTFEATWDGRDAQGNVVSSGTYFYTLTVGDQFTETQKMTLLK
jgi:flagellar hook assembly protein FlgD